jgi:hypothetical protein
VARPEWKGQSRGQVLIIPQQSGPIRVRQGAPRAKTKNSTNPRLSIFPSVIPIR